MIVTDPGTRGGGKGNEYGLWVYLSQQQNTDGRGCVGGKHYILDYCIVLRV